LQHVLDVSHLLVQEPRVLLADVLVLLLQDLLVDLPEQVDLLQLEIELRVLG
jgi:hypothetical protein